MPKIIDIEPEYVEVDGVERRPTKPRKKRRQENPINGIAGMIDQGEMIVNNWESLAVGYFGGMLFDAMEKKRNGS